MSGVSDNWLQTVREGSSPVMRKMLDEIVQYGIREARSGHFRRMELITRYKASPALFFGAIRPALSTQEAIDDAKQVIAAYKRTPTYRRESQFARVAIARRNILLCRYFRRFGQRIWAREAA